jgi:hypothetical protein
MSLRLASSVAIALVAVSWAAMVIPPGANQTAHYATLVAVANGSANIDRERRWTGDTAYLNGHFYAAKAPGLALATVPWYVALRDTGAVQPFPSPSTPFPTAQATFSRANLWEAALWGSILPGAILLFLVRRLVEKLVPGYGTAAAMSVGVAGVMAVMATMFFDHVLSACLSFAAFALLVPDENRKALRFVAAAGLLAGLAISVELPVALVAVALGLWTAFHARRWLPVGVFAAGVAVGLSPLLIFNSWAFGSPFTLAYSNAVAVPGLTGHDVVGQNSSGLFGVGLPRAHGFIELLFSGYGLLVLAPIWGAAMVGLALLWRDGRRDLAVLISALCAAFLLYNAAYKDLFGAMTTGPRFLAPLLPFLAIPLASAWRRAPVTTSILFIASAVVTWTMILANPMGPAEDPGTFFRRLADGGEKRVPLSGTVLDWIWPGHNGISLALVAIVVGLAIALAATSVPWRFSRRDAAFAIAAALAWRVVYVAGTTILKLDKNTLHQTGAIAVALIAVAIGIALSALARARALVAAPAVLLLPLVWARVDGKPSAAGALAGVAIAGMTVITLADRWRVSVHRHRIKVTR